MRAQTKIFLFFALTAAVFAVPVAKQDQHQFPHEPVEDLNAASEYDFAYSVESEKTGDFKSHRESRNKEGDVKGVFSFVEPDGYKRTVKYFVSKDSGFIADVNREKVSGYQAPQYKYVQYDHPAPKKVQATSYEDYSRTVPEPKHMESFLNQLPSLDLPEYQKKFHYETVNHEQEPVKYQKQQVEEEQTYQTEDHHEAPVFLEQQQQPPKFENTYKPFVIVTDNHEHKYEEYKLPEQHQLPSPQEFRSVPTQYQQEEFKQQTAPQQFYHSDFQRLQDQESLKYDQVATSTEHPEVQTAKYEVKYEHYEDATPQYQHQPVPQTEQKHEEQESSVQKDESETPTEGPVKQYRFSPLKDLYQFVINKAKSIDGAEPAPAFLQ